MNRRSHTALAVLSSIGLHTSAAFAHDPAPNEAPRIQIAILLDTSNSMDGLINQAKTQLWKITNEFSKARRDGKPPRLEVALYQYGNDSLLVTEAFIQQVTPFTTDLDLISEKLFALSTNGGEEYCGAVIHRAVRQLDWSSDPHAFKAIYIAGNEPFTQGTTDYREACAKAFGGGVVINTIHCGESRVGLNGQWADGARIGGGKALNINQDHVRPTIRCPQDEEIAKLSAALNDTYVPYGPHGAAGQARQAAQDQNASVNASVGSDVARANAKASSSYVNGGWDLVDAVNRDNAKLEEIKEENLPENMRKMSPEERKEYVKQQAAKRAELQSQIGKLNTEREKIVLAEEARLAGADVQTLDTAIVETIREQVKGKQFEITD